MPGRVRLLQRKCVKILIVFQLNYCGIEPNNWNQCGKGKIKIEKRGTTMKKAATIPLGRTSHGTIGSRLSGANSSRGGQIEGWRKKIERRLRDNHIDWEEPTAFI